MHKQMIFWLLIWCVVACTPSTTGESLVPGESIVLGVYRGGRNNTARPLKTYTVGANGSGEVSAKLPGGLGEEPRWSRDGRWIAFTVQDPNPNSPDLYIMRSDGQHRTPALSEPRGANSPAWSPDGTRVAYFDAGRQRGIYLVNVECLLRGEACQLTPTFLTEGAAPDWSPDGKSIIYQANPATFFSESILTINVDGTGQPTTLTPELDMCQHPRWSPDGQRIVFSCAGTIYVARKDGSKRQELTEGRDPTWSPDGTRIAFVSTRDGLGQCIDSLTNCGSSPIFSNGLAGYRTAQSPSRSYQHWIKRDTSTIHPFFHDGPC